MLHKAQLRSRGFRTLSSQEVGLVAGGYYHEDPIPGSIPGDIGEQLQQQRAALLASYGIYTHEGGEGNEIIVTGDRGGSDNPFGGLNSGTGNGSHEPFDPHDPFSDEMYVLEQMMLNSTNAIFTDHDSDGVYDTVDFYNGGNFIGLISLENSSSEVTSAAVAAATNSSSSGDGDGSFYGGGSIALGTGAGFGLSEGGNTAAWLLGLGGTLEFGYSSDDARAAIEADNSELRFGAGVYNPWVLTLDFDPFTVGVEITYGITIPIAELHSEPDDSDADPEPAPGNNNGDGENP